MLDISPQCDVVAIGGGPAGSLASTFLVQIDNGEMGVSGVQARLIPEQMSFGIRCVYTVGYQAGKQVSHLAQRSVQFESSLEQELMNVVSQMTTRSVNFQNLVKDRTSSATADKFKVLEGIAF